MFLKTKNIFKHEFQYQTKPNYETFHGKRLIFDEPATSDSILSRDPDHIYKLEIKASIYGKLEIDIFNCIKKKIFPENIYNCHHWPLYPLVRYLNLNILIGPLQQYHVTAPFFLLQLWFPCPLLFQFLHASKMRPNLSLIDHCLKTSNKVGPWGP